MERKEKPWKHYTVFHMPKNEGDLECHVSVCQVTINDVIAAERLFGTLGHIAATETPHCRLLLLLEESR